MGLQLVEYFGQHGICHFLATLERVRTVHEHLRLHDRHDILLLAQRRIARQRVGVGFDRETRRNAGADVYDRAPLGETGANLVVRAEPLAQPVQPFGDRLIDVRGREEQFAVGAALLLGGGDAQLLEALAAGAVALVCSQNPLVRCHHRARDALQIRIRHSSILQRYGAAIYQSPHLSAGAAIHSALLISAIWH